MKKNGKCSLPFVLVVPNLVEEECQIMQNALKQLFWGCSRPLREVLGASLGIIGCVLDALEGLSQTSWALLSLVGVSWEVLGRLPGNLQDLLGALVDTCWLFLECHGGLLWPHRTSWGTSWGHLKTLLDALRKPRKLIEEENAETQNSSASFRFR